MSIDEKKAEVIEMLASHEEAIARLYVAYSEAYPDMKDFWSGLAAEEVEHATWLRNLIPQIEEGSVYFDERRFQIQAIKTSQNYLEELKASVQKEKPPAIKALSAALDIEKALIERGYFRVAQTDSPGLKQTFENLAKSTTTHIEKVRDAWFEAKTASCTGKKPDD
jgi:rubrerythrin